METSTRPTKDMHSTVGIVTSIDGSSFTVEPIGQQATTTVSTDSSTIFRADGGTTTQDALEVGAHVALIGISTSDTNISASVVSIISKGFDFFKNFFQF